MVSALRLGPTLARRFCELFIGGRQPLLICIFNLYFMGPFWGIFTHWSLLIILVLIDLKFNPSSSQILIRRVLFFLFDDVILGK